MAFFCPIRVRKNKKKKENDLLDGRAPSISGRITGSNSIETLVRVGLEKENGIPSDSKMIILHDFTPCVDDELDVKRGQIVTILYQENDWVYVIRESDPPDEGFIPFSYCTPVSSQLADIVIKHKKIPRNSDMIGFSNKGFVSGISSSMDSMAGILFGPGSGIKEKDLLLNALKGTPMNSTNKTTSNNNNTVSQMKTPHPSIMSMMHHLSNHSDPDIVGGNGGNHNGDSSSKDLESHYSAAASSDIHPFFKDPSGRHRFIVLYNFIARDENDINVERGEFVTVLNMDDPDWYWILRSDGLEGFVPSAFLCSLDADALNGKKTQQQQSSQSQSQSNHPATNSTTTGQPQPAIPSSCNSHLLISGSNNNNMNNSGNTEESTTTTTYSNSIDGGNSQHGLPILSFPGHLRNESNNNNNLIRGSAATGFLSDELVMLYDYKAQAPDDLSVRRGEWLYADLKEQKIDGWIWAFAPTCKKYGFIPKAYARPPAMTSI